MTIRDRKQLKQTAARRLENASYSPRRLILIHSGVALAFSLLLALCDYIVTWQINAHGSGLSGIQLRSILETVYNTLSIIWTIAAPFWAFGLVHAALRLIRGKSAWPHTLLEGFRRAGPVIRFLLIQILIYSVITLASIYAAWSLYISVTPAGRAFTDGLWELIASGVDYSQLIEQIPEQVMDRVSRGYLPFFGVIAAALMIPAMYRMRLGQYLLMEDKALTPWKAICLSGKVMRRNCIKMFLLDLSYWWYYLIPVVLMLPCSAEVLAQKLQLPVDGNLLALGGNVVYVVLTLIFEYLAKPKAVTTYALAYEALMEEYNAANPPAEQEVQ